MNTDTPLPPDFPAGENPPDGAVIDYYLKSDATGPVKLEILERIPGQSRTGDVNAGDVVMSFSSDDRLQNPDPKDVEVPMYWLRPVQNLSGKAGMHRFLWDMHLPRIKSIKPTYPIAAIPHNTPPDATSPWVMPGEYVVVLTVNNHSYSQPLTIKMDPQVKISTADLERQFTLSKQVYEALQPVANAAAEAEHVEEQVTKLRAQQSSAKAALDAFDQKIKTVVGEGGRRPRGGTPDTLVAMRGALQALMGTFQDADFPPTSQAAAAVPELTNAAPALINKWTEIKTTDLPTLNQQLRAAKLTEISTSAH
jgi:hypothetical protein